MVENIPEGYKKTEVGVIPEEWKIKNLGDTSILKARIGWQGLTTKEYLTSGEYYLITGTDFIDSRIKWQTCFCVEKERYIQDKNIQIKDKDVLVTKDGTIGKIAYIENMTKPATLNSGVFVIRPKNKEYIPKYFYYVLISKYFDDFLKQLTAGSTINHLYQKDFVNYNFVCPPLLEQKAIANALSNIDSLISSLEKLIDKKKNIKQGAMQELLTGKKRLEGFKCDFKYVKLKSVCEVFMDGDWIEAKDQSTSGIRLIQTGNIGVGNFEYKHKHARYISQETFKRLNCKEVKKGDVLVSRLPEPAGRSCIIPDIGVPMITSVDCTIIRFKPQYLANIFVNYTSTKKYNDDVSIMLSGSTRKRISRSSLGNILVPMFEIEEQTAIAQILSDMDKEIEKLNVKLNKYKQIKQGMMQELLTGKRRLI